MAAYVEEDFAPQQSWLVESDDAVAVGIKADVVRRFELHEWHASTRLLIHDMDRERPAGLEWARNRRQCARYHANHKESAPPASLHAGSTEPGIFHRNGVPSSITCFEIGPASKLGLLRLDKIMATPPAPG
jgi:hypothetical protein